jgi:HAD superfamily hydrolase (TIGR01459 family)
MTQIIASLAKIPTRYDAVFCDLWGCLHNGKTLFPAAVAALQSFRSKGGKVVLLTNAPRPKQSVIRQLDAMGLPRDAWDEVVTSGDAAQYALITGAVGRRVFHIGAPKDETFFTDFADDLQDTVAAEPPILRTTLEEAEGIVCTGLVDDMTETPDDYRSALLFSKTMDLPMLCANPDVVVDYGDKRLFCAGAIAQAYAEMGGRVFYFGKPHPPIYDLARRRLSALMNGEDTQILCIGDGISTDIQGGQSEGMDTLFITGGIAADQFGSDISNPNKDLLENWLSEKQISATFAMGSLC